MLIRPIYVFEPVDMPTVQHKHRVAVRPDLFRDVGDDDHRAITAPLEQFVMALLVKPGVAHGKHLIDQKAVELHCHGDSEGQPGAHAGGVSSDRFPHVRAQFGKLLDKRDERRNFHAVHTADKAQVVQACQAALEGAAKRQGPGNAHVALNISLRRQFCAADQADKRGLARSIAAQDSDLLAAAHPQADIVQHRMRATPRVIPLGHPVQHDHCNNSTRRLVSWVSASPTKSNARFQTMR